jgi:23S rRNA pseudouridine1911/1915/1917 synthase
MDENVLVGADEDGRRLDKFLATRLPALSRSFAQHLIAEGHVRVAGRVREPDFRVSAGEVVSVEVPPPQPTAARGEAIPLSIVYEDDALLVVNKPAGMVVHPAAGHSTGTLVNAVLGHSPDLVIGNAERPGIVHRLDRDTSGLIVIAKTDAALENLQQQFARQAVHKTYLALVHGRVQPSRGKIDAPVGRDPRDRKRMAVTAVQAARAAQTVFAVVERMADTTLLRVEPHTGRTHQIRVHLAFIGHPVVGDPVYGPHGANNLGLRRQFLHAWQLAFTHPVTGAALTFTAPLPLDLQQALRRAGGDPTGWT